MHWTFCIFICLKVLFTSSIILRCLFNHIFSIAGARVEEGKKFSKVAERNICITMAAIDPSKCKGTDPITLYKKKDDVEYVVCSLMPGSLYQQKLNLLFDMGEELNFLTKGNG